MVTAGFSTVPSLGSHRSPHSVVWKEASLDEVTDFLTVVTGKNFVMLAGTRVRFEMRNVTVAAVLDAIVNKAGDLEWKVEDGIVLVLPREGAHAPPARELTKEVRALDRIVDVRLKDATLESAVRDLGDGLDVRIGEKARAKVPRFSLRLHAVTARAVIHLLCRMHGLRCTIQGQRVTLDLE